jgi:hypothetical protein
MGDAQYQLPDVELGATYFLDEDWEPTEAIPPVSGAKSAGDDEQVRNWIRATTITIAPYGTAVKLTPSPDDPGFDYLKSELGMNIVLPRGRIDELRFKVTLTQAGSGQETFATDGFPNSSIRNTPIVNGQISIGISKAFKLIPIIGDVATELLSVDLGPWNFRIGSLKHVDVAFNGGLTSEPDWYFKDAGIANDEIRVAMLLKKSKATTKITANVQAAWLYDPPSILKKRRVGTDAKAVILYGQ